MEKKIVGAEETIEMTPAGELRRLAVYRFTLDALGPFEHRIPVTEDTTEHLKETIRRKEQILEESVKG